MASPAWHTCGPALSLRVVATCGRARALEMRLPHGPLRTPVFMPVGTQGTVKGVSTLELQAQPLDCEIILGNTYHLGCRPGGALLAGAGGLHGFMAWPRNILTDSGGFQMVSLAKLSAVTEEGVTFQSPVDGSMMLLTPEMSMQLQNQIGSDIMMALDDVVSSVSPSRERVEEANHRTLRWIDRCIAAHAKPASQSLFGILQGGLDVAPGGMRDVNLAGMLQRDAALPGYAIGGLAGGEEKDAFWRVVDFCCARLPAHKPRYLMGVGFPLDLVVCTALGVDMYDCVYPTRTARFGTALVGCAPGGLLKLKTAACAGDARPLEEDCGCDTCARYTRAHLHLLLKTDAVGPQLLSVHNIAHMMRLVRRMRAAIEAGSYTQFVQRFMVDFYGGRREALPRWVADACAAAGIDCYGAFANAAAVGGGGGGGGEALLSPSPKRAKAQDAAAAAADRQPGAT
jgi:tRNA-guanine transglycosylase